MCLSYSKVDWFITKQIVFHDLYSSRCQWNNIQYCTIIDRFYMNAYVHNIFLIKMNKKKEARGQGFSYVTFPSEIIIKKKFRADKYTIISIIINQFLKPFSRQRARLYVSCIYSTHVVSLIVSTSSGCINYQMGEKKFSRGGFGMLWALFPLGRVF